jgi:ABC-type amino acid transport system permease subunit
MFGNFDFDVIERSWMYLFTTGMKFTLQLTALSMAGGIVFGLAVMVVTVLPVLVRRARLRAMGEVGSLR